MIVRALATLAAAALGVAAAPALAQLPEAGRLLESVRERPSLTPPGPERPVLELPAEAPASAPADGVRVRVAEFAFEGNDSIPADELRAELADLAGAELDFAGLQAAAARITRLYRARGYLVARAYVPRQDIAAGRIAIAVLEGKLGRLIVERAAGVRLEEERVRGYLEDLRAGAPLRSRELDRALLLLTDLAGVSVRARLRPGAQPGTADLLVRVSESRALQGRGTADNYGTHYTGRLRATAELTLNDRFGLGEQFSLRGLTSFEGLTSVNAALSMPLGTSGLRAGVGAAQLDYKIGREFAPLGATGSANVASAWLSHPLLRGRNANLWAQVGVDSKRFHDNIETANSIAIRTSQLYTAALNGNWGDGVLGGGRNAASLQYGVGELRRESAGDAAFDALSAQSAGKFAKLNYSLSRLQALPGGFTLLGAFSGQGASRNLDSSEKFYLGGPAGVRAYAQGEGAGDEGWLGTLELRRALGAIAGFQVEGSLFHDAGAVRIDRNAWDPAQTSNRRRLSGTGFGLTLAKARSVTVSMVVAFRGENGPTLTEPPRGQQFWIQVSMLPGLGSGAGASGGRPAGAPFETYGSIGLMAEGVSRDGATPAGPRGATQSLTPTGQNLPSYLRVRDPTSYAGVRGATALGGGTDFFWQAETGFTYVWNEEKTGDSGAPANSMSSTLRDTAAGLRSATLGTAFYGKWDTPMKESSQALDPFSGNTIGSHTNLMGSPGFGVSGSTSFGPLSHATDANNDDAAFNRRQSGIWQYWTPEWRGLSGRIAYSGNGRRAAPDVPEGRLWSSSLAYRIGGVKLAAAYERHDNYFGIASLGRNNRGVGTDAAGSVTENTWSRDWNLRLAASYAFGATEITAMLDRLHYREFGVIPALTIPDLETYRRDAWMLLAQHQLGALELRASYGKALPGNCTAISADPAQRECTTGGLGATMLAAGFQYALRKNVALFGHYVVIRNEPSASYNFAVGGVFGASGRAPGVGADPKGYGVGAKYTF